MKSVNLIFPHQLFEESPLISNQHEIYLIEEFLFFKKYSFHKQKIAFHRASMKAYEAYLLKLDRVVHYIDAQNPISDIRKFSNELTSKNVGAVHFINPTDNWLEKRIRKMAAYAKLEIYENPIFLNNKEDLANFFRTDKKSFHQTTFYKQQRKKHKILIDEAGNPVGGKWTYDVDNRKKYPKGKTPPKIQYPEQCKDWSEAVVYSEKYFSNNPGRVSENRIYPISFAESQNWLNQFLHQRFYDFGVYEDAIVKDASILNHSLLSPLMNVGLLLPNQVVGEALKIAKQDNIPVNSTEGFIRQIIGWREFIRGIYVVKGTFSRNRNFWKFNRKIPSSFYDGTTGIDPIDGTIKKVLETGYCHHIERLMILGNFMLLCEFDPDEVYKWFMELFIDAYDWVMVPNVYGMCLFADGGVFATKPYIGGSNYLRKMSNYPRGPWEDIWDGLFWRFVHKHQGFFKTNRRTSMLLFSLNRKSDEKLQTHLEHAEAYIKSKLEDSE